jgi:hypothetical protein
MRVRPFLVVRGAPGGAPLRHPAGTASGAPHAAQTVAMCHVPPLVLG